MNTLVAGNTVAEWLIALGIAVLAVIVLVLVRSVAVARIKSFAERTATRVDDLAAEVLSRTRTFFLIAVGVAIAKAWLDVTPVWTDRLRIALVVIFFAQVGIWTTAATRFVLENYRQRKLESDRGAATMVGALQFLVVLVVWSVVFLLALDNLGVDITALVAGLGVGGIAIALAVQKILGDLFASLAIILDKPFVVGDFIRVGEEIGTVERIGLKTTRVASISGEQLIFSNADLLSARIRNFGRMQERRVMISLGVTYQTSRSNLELIPTLIRAAIEADDILRFDRSHFSGYGAFSIDFETVYFVKTPAFVEHMDAQQRVLLRIHEAFEQHKVDFAYPTQTLFLTRGGAESEQKQPR